jgi:hypothetical protein
MPGENMRNVFLLVTPVLCLAVLGCPKKGADADAGDLDSAPVVQAVVDAAPALPAAKNAGDIARFAAETAIADDDFKLVDAFTTVRTGPKQGGVVTTLRAGTDVVKIADYQGAFLITFVDPKDPSSRLMGWIDKGAFVQDVIVDAGPRDAAKDAAPDAAVAVVDAGFGLVCPANNAVVVGLAPTPVCKKKCKEDKECAGGVAGSCVTAQTPDKKLLKVCRAD